MVQKSSLYTALTLAVMSTLLLMSYTLLQYFPQSGPGEALLIRVPQLSTEVWGVFNPATGDLRYGSKIDEVRPIASVTKLLTAYAVMEAENLDASATVSWSDLATEGEAGKLVYGKTYTLRTLLFPLLIESSNDAGTMISRMLGDRLARSVEELITTQSLAQTVVAEPTGLSPENVSSARDLAKLYAYIRQNHPYVTDITQLNMYLDGTTGLINNNPLRELDTFTGGKHGYTPEAGKTFVGTFRVERGEVGIILLGSTDLRADVEEILKSFN